MLNSPFSACLCLCEHAYKCVTLWVCSAPLSRHICLALISYGWQKNPALSLVFNNSWDGGHLSKSEYSWGIVCSFSKISLNSLSSLYSQAACKEVCLLCMQGQAEVHRLLCIFWLLSSHFLFFLCLSFFIYYVKCLIQFPWLLTSPRVPPLSFPLPNSFFFFLGTRSL